MKIIGRDEEIKSLHYLSSSKKPEFVVVYGRRRVGKTFLIKEYFKNNFAFYATGLPEKKQRDQLKNFRDFLKKYGHKAKGSPVDWFEAFDRLQELLESSTVMRDESSQKRVVFLDEVPWMDGKRSMFKAALDRFWNSWGSSQEDLLLIVCGSATSWIIRNFLKDEGGFYNRLTDKIHLMPFSLVECEAYCKEMGLILNKKQIIELYMVFGGVPYYWSLIRRGESHIQAVDRLCFNEGGALTDEYSLLFKSLFSANGPHRRIVETMAKCNMGVFRKDFVDHGISNGKGLSEAIEELEQCGFIRGYHNATKKTQGVCYQLIDPFLRFALSFMQNKRVSSWIQYAGSKAYSSWSGIAFELVCLNHIPSLKKALGVSGVLTNVSAWRSKNTKPGAQIDLLLERKDGITNVCEIKFSLGKFVIDANYEETLIHKLEAFQNESKTRQSLHLTLITLNGLMHNEYSSIVVSEIVGDDLFA